MSLLGFDALARQALGQLPARGLTNTVLPAATGSYGVIGHAAAFQAIAAGSAGAFAAAGNVARFGNSTSATAGSYLVTANPALFSRTLAAGPAACALNGQFVAMRVRMPSLTRTYLLNGKAVSTITSAALGTGVYVVTGCPSSFLRDFEAWFPRPFDSDTWTGSVIQGETWILKHQVTTGWNSETEPSSSWTPATIPPESWTTE